MIPIFRSGRKLSNFLELVPAPTKSEAKAPKRPQHRKLYVQVKGTEDMIEIDVDKNRPKNFASKEEANDWEEKTLRDILRFKKFFFIYKTNKGVSSKPSG